MWLALAQLALAACPEGSDAPEQFASDVDATLWAYAAGDSAAYVVAWSRVEVDLACVEAPLSPGVVASYFLLQGVHADLLGEPEVDAWFAAARLADPTATLPEAVVRAKPALGAVGRGDGALPQPHPIADRPGLSLRVDGRDVPVLYEGVPALVQALDEQGAVKWTGVVRSEAEIPAVLAPVDAANRGLLAARGYALVRVEPGAVEMRTDALDGLARAPTRTASITRPFLIGATEVTVEVWEAVHGGDPAGATEERRPVRGVSWFDVARFCNTLSRLEGLREAYRIHGDEVVAIPGADGYRLPTEAEWVLAAGDRFDYAGGDEADAVAWHARNAGGRPHLVATKAANARGLYDLSGNVAEWVWDTDAPWDPAPATDPAVDGPSRYRIVRGGSYMDKGRALRLSARRALPATREDETVGFRVARTLDR